MTVHKDLVERLRQAALIPRPTVKEKQLILFAADTLEKLRAIEAYQACPKAIDIKKEHLDALYGAGFGCRAWGISDTEVMQYAVEIGVEGGMTVNFPDKLVEYMKNR